MMFLPIIFIGLIIWAVIYFTRRSNTSGGASEESAREILRRRYARGEISREEFEERKKSLG